MPKVLEEEPKTEIEEEINFLKICRTCLSEDEQLTNIFDVTFEGVTIPEIFDRYMKMQLVEGDDLPQNICYACLYEMCRLYKFICYSKNSETKLQKLLSTECIEEGAEEFIVETDIKTEDEEEPVEDIKEELEEIEENDDASENDEELEEDKIDLHKLGPIKVAEVGPPFTCFCGDEYETLEELKLHRSERKHTRNIKRYLCRICNPSKLYTYKTWFGHMKSHKDEKKYQCEICGRMFKSANNHYRHLRSHKGDKPFVCEVCGKRFSRTTGLKQHILNYHTENDDSNSDVPKKKKIQYIRNDLYCSKCDTSIYGVVAYKKHMYEVHNIPQYICQTCGKQFAHLASLNTHLLLHTGEKQFKCSMCEKSFVQKTHLHTHFKIHTGEKPYECPYCGKKFALNGNLTVHKRIHTGEKPYVCNICNKGFYDSSSMKTHRKKH